jgi:hypothetical protein
MLVAAFFRDLDFKLDDWNQMRFLPTHFDGYLDDLMSIHEIRKCLEKSAFRQMRLFPQNLLATCSCDFDFNLDDWNQMHFCQHFLLAFLITSCPFLELEIVWKV